MDPNEIYDTQAGLEDSGERLEKKEQLRAKVQALVSYYEDEKRRNEELTMELERLKAEQQQMQGMSGPISLGGPAPFPQPPQGPFAQPGGMPPGMGMPGIPGAPDPPPAAPGGYTLQNFGAPAPQGMPPQGMGMPPQGMPPQGMGMPPQRPTMPPQAQNPYGAPPPFGSPPQGFPPQGMPPGSPNQPGMPPQQPPFGPPQGFPPQGMPPGFPNQPVMPPQQQPHSQPGFPPAAPHFGQQPFGQQPGGYPPQPPAYPGMGLGDNIGAVLQTITQVRSKLHQFESIRGYGYPQQPAYVDYDTVALLDKLYDQLGDLSRELMQRR